jgi:uncharacterized phage-associated protein
LAVEFEFDLDRTLAAVTYLASKNVPDLTTYKLLKLVFLSDKYHLVKYGRTITGDKYCALEDGPVPSNVYNILKDVLGDRSQYEGSSAFKENLQIDKRFQYPHIHAKKSFDVDELSRSDVAALDRAVEVFGKMDFFQLKAITHEMIAYKNAWKTQTPEDKKSWPMAFEDFFEEDPNAIAGALDEMLETDFIRKALV